MKAFVTLFFGVLLWMPFYVNAAGDGQFPATGGETPETKPAGSTPEVAIAGRVSRAVFTSDVKDHEPVDSISTLDNDKTRICYFTEIRGMAGQTVVHRWEYKGKVLLEMPFKVGSSRWRAYSIKTLDPSWLGEWKASVVDASGSSLSVNTFTYVKKPGGGPAAAQTTPVAKP
jgi:Protein of unknown function (DUF2914)